MESWKLYLVEKKWFDKYIERRKAKSSEFQPKKTFKLSTPDECLWNLYIKKIFTVYKVWKYFSLFFIVLVHLLESLCKCSKKEEQRKVEKTFEHSNKNFPCLLVIRLQTKSFIHSSSDASTRTQLDSKFQRRGVEEV